LLTDSRNARRELVRSQPQSSQFQSELGTSDFNIGWIFSQTGKPAEALESCREALAIQEKLAEAHPEVPQYQSDLASTHHVVGIVDYQSGRPAVALTSWNKALEIRQKLAAANPSVSAFQRILAVTYYNMGMPLRETGQVAKALDSYQRAVNIQEVLVRDNPGVTSFHSDLARTYNNIANVMKQTGKPSQALESYGNAVAIARRLTELDPGTLQFQSDLAMYQNNIAGVLREMGEPQKALDWCDKAVTLQRKLVAAAPRLTEFRNDLGESLDVLTTLRAQTGALTKALEALAEEEAIWQGLINDDPTSRDYLAWAANCQTSIAEMLIRTRRYEEAGLHCGRALSAWEPLIRQHPDVVGYRHCQATSLLRDAQVRSGLGDLRGAAQSAQKAVGIWESITSPSGEHMFTKACVHAVLASLAGRPNSGIDPASRPREEEKALADLRDSIGQGLRSIDLWRTESGLDALRALPGFEMLLRDVAMPARPFGD
jgi:tetratricopeptide (TPR) repeat protein